MKSNPEVKGFLDGCGSGFVDIGGIASFKDALLQRVGRVFLAEDTIGCLHIPGLFKTLLGMQRPHLETLYLQHLR